MVLVYCHKAITMHRESKAIFIGANPEYRALFAMSDGFNYQRRIRIVYHWQKLCRGLALPPHTSLWPRWRSCGR